MTLVFRYAHCCAVCAALLRLSLRLSLFLSLSLAYFVEPLTHKNALSAQSIADFTSIEPGPQTDQFAIPSSHQFQKIYKTGETYNGVTVRDQLDYTAYVPIGGSSSNGYLSVNSEWSVGGVMVCDLTLNASTGLWSFTNLTDIDFSGFAGTAWNCSGAVTPWGTVLSCEERVISTDTNADGYNDNGWAVEIDPVNKVVIDKRWAMGNFKHENAAVHTNQRTVYQGVDDATGYLYKFVATTATDLSAGKLFVFKGPKNGTTGQWIELDNSTPAECNSTLAQSNTVGATVFNGIEDVEIGPDGWIYFAVKNEEQVYRFQDPNALTGTGAIEMENFVGGPGVSYDIVHPNGTTNEPWGDGCDNLAFDGEGNLWVFQDGGRNYIWVVGSDHTAASPNVRIFGRVPNGAEPTGITFTPDYKYLFMSVMHPSSSNNANQSDMTGTVLDFDDDVSLVISRLPGAFPIELAEFVATPAGQAVLLTWTTASEVNNAYFSVERSEDGVLFQPIDRVDSSGSATTPQDYLYTDESVQPGRTYYYRLRQVDFDGSATYSPIVSVSLNDRLRLHLLRLSPNPVSGESLQLNFIATYSGPARLAVFDNTGRKVDTHPLAVTKGNNRLEITLPDLPAGTYAVQLSDDRGETLLVQKLVKGG